MFACGAKGRCTTCRVRVVAGGELLAPPTAAEEKFRRLGHLADDERLTCQARFARTGILVGVVPRPCQLPHVTYAEAPAEGEGRGTR